MAKQVPGRISWFFLDIFLEVGLEIWSTYLALLDVKFWPIKPGF